MYLVGIILSLSLMKFNKAVGYCTVLYALIISILSFQKYNNNFAAFLDGTITSGILIGFVSYFILRFIVLRMFNIKPIFRKFYITKAKVLDQSTMNFSGSNTTIQNGVFGNLEARTNNYSYNIDTLFIQDKNNHVMALNDVNKNMLAKTGDEIIIAGYNGLPENLFYNKTENRIYNTAIPSKLNVLITSILFCIPFIGNILVLGHLIKVMFQNRGVICEHKTEYDFLNIFFTLIYLTIILFMVGIQFPKNPDIGYMTKHYLFMTLPVIILQYQSLRLDCIRFQNFLYEKIKDLS